MGAVSTGESAPPRTSLLSRIFVPAKPGSPIVRFGFAAACCAVAFLIRFLLDPVLQDRSPLLLFALAVALSAIRGGFGPGLFAVLLGAFGAPYFFPPVGKYFYVEPGYRATAVIQLLLFVAVGLILTWLASEMRAHELRLRDTLRERDAALEHVRLLSGLVPICAGCKKIRDDQGNWQQMESYISAHSEAQFSHGLCPTCARRYMDDLPNGN